MLSIDPNQVPTADLHQYLLGSVAPRPICFASTIDENGRPNLAPYSFFNAFSSNPPTMVFSSNRRVSNNTTKDTLHNVQANGEVVINVVNYAIVQQMTIASIDYDSDISEFEKAGLTPVASDLIKPFRVKESPVQMECKVSQIIPLGENGGAGNLIVCDLLKMHINEEILDDEMKIDPQKIDLVGRMGRAFYCRASGDSVFKIFRPVNQIAIGFDALPKHVKTSKVLTGNDLAQLAGLKTLSSSALIERVKGDADFIKIQSISTEEDKLTILHEYVKNLISEEKEIEKALAFLLAHS